MDLQGFLSANRINFETWEQAAIDWSELNAIAIDHDTQRQALVESATFHANLIQRIPSVHSVRWRIKDTEHLLEKIIRKRAAKEDKYLEIDRNNYYTVVTDLIGIRALHLFKDDCFDIHRSLTADWTPLENPVAYIRNGDPEQLTNQYREHGLEVKIHPAGYRSVHYVFSSQPLNRRVIAEVQIRTIFEEGWSEIDHAIRYPNFSNNELVGYFLTIFNRLAGSADEMGTFVRGLTGAIHSYQLQISQASAERDASLRSMEESLEELARLKQQDNDSQNTIRKLREQMSKMKQERSLDNIFSSSSSANKLSQMLYESSTGNLLKEIQLAQSALKNLNDPSLGSALTKIGVKWPPDKT